MVTAIPQEHSSYKPDPASRSALELAWHIISSGLRFLTGVAESSFDLTLLQIPADPETTGQFAEWHGQAFQSAVDKLRQAPREMLVLELNYRGNLEVPCDLLFADSFDTHNSPSGATVGLSSLDGRIGTGDLRLIGLQNSQFLS